MKYYDIGEDDMFDCTWNDAEFSFNVWLFWLSISMHKHHDIHHKYYVENGPGKFSGTLNEFKWFAVSWKSKWREDGRHSSHRVSSVWFSLHTGRRKYTLSFRYVKNIPPSMHQVDMEARQAEIDSQKPLTPYSVERDVLRKDGKVVRIRGRFPQFPS